MVDITQIREHMEVIDSDGKHTGTVDHVEGDTQIKLTRTDPLAGGEHHWISIEDVEAVDEHVHLSVTASEAINEASAEGPTDSI